MKAYGGLGKLGYSHEIIHHTGEVGGNLLSRINLTISLLKRWLLGTHQGHGPHLVPSERAAERDSFGEVVLVGTSGG